MWYRIGLLLFVASACNPRSPAVIDAPGPDAFLYPPAERCADATKRGPIEVAITVDDLPRHGPLPPGATRTQVVDDLLAVFAAHQVPSVYGVVNGARMTDADTRTALEHWHAAGHKLGSHGYSHANPDDVSAQAFMDEIDRNEPVLQQIVGTSAAAQHEWKVYRFPFLQQGTSLAERAALRAHLTERGYRIADATTNYADWAFTEPYARCKTQNDTATIARMTTQIHQDAEAQLVWSDAVACKLLNRPIKHVLLLHNSAFTALTLDHILTRLEAIGVRWISFDDAQQDPIYRDEPNPPVTWKGPLLDLILDSRDIGPPVPRPRWSDPSNLCP